MNITDVGLAYVPEAQHEIIGISPGDKLHELTIGFEDGSHTYEYPEHYKILPAIHNWSRGIVRIRGGRLVHADFTYYSDSNPQWMSVEALSNWIADNYEKIGRI